jgi:hypothetical protein
MFILNLIFNTSLREWLVTKLRRFWQSTSDTLSRKLVCVGLIIAFTALITYCIAAKYRPYKIKEVSVEKRVVVEKLVYTDNAATNIFAIATVVVDEDGVQHLDLKQFYAHDANEAYARMWGLVMASGYKKPKQQMYSHIQIK